MVALLKRRLLLILACTIICGAAATLFAGSANKTYSADGYFLVPNGPVVEGGGQNAYDAQRLAATYSVVMTEDRALHDAVASRAAVSPDSVANSIRTAVVDNSSVIRVTWSSQSESAVAAFFPALVEVLSADPALTPALPTDALGPINLPDDVIAQNNASTLAIPLALILGLVVGIAGAVMLERAAPRIDTPVDATTLIGLPGVDVNRLSAAGIAAVVSRMQRDSGVHPLRVAVLGLPSIDNATIADVAVRLEGAVGLPVMIASSGNGNDVEALRGGRLDGTGEAERIAQTADVTVLVFDFGCRAAEIVSATERLGQFDKAPDWLLGVSSRRALARLAKAEEVQTTIDIDEPTRPSVSV